MVRPSKSRVRFILKAIKTAEAVRRQRASKGVFGASQKV